MIKKALILVLGLLSLYGTARFCHHETKGFRLSKLQNNTSDLFSSPPLPPSYAEVLEQPFTYLGRGKQSFSFQSADGQVVLKFFQNRYQRRLFWLSLPLFKAKKERTYEKLKAAFTSYQIAQRQLFEETALLYLHPAKSADCPTITLIDPLNIRHRIDLGRYAFALQKKATMSYPYFEACAKARDWTKAKEGFLSLFHLLRSKMQRGIADNDPLIRTNFGFVEGKAVQVDIGPFSYDPSLEDPAIQKKELHRITLSLRHWLENHHKELLPAFYEALNAI